jgi:hypothetical protein
MISNSTKTIPIFESVEITKIGGTSPSTRPRQTRGIADHVAKLAEVSVDVLSQNMANFIGGLSEVLSSGDQAAGSFDIDAVEVQCQISSSGKIGLAGTGVDIQGGSTLKIVFKKRK